MKKVIIHPNIDIDNIFKTLLGESSSEITKYQRISPYEPKIGNLYLYLLHVVTVFSLCAHGEYRLSKDRAVDIALVPRINPPLVLIEVKRHKILRNYEEVSRLREQLKSYIKLSLERHNSLIPILVLMDSDPNMPLEKFSGEVSRLMELIKGEISKFCKYELKKDIACEKYISYVIIEHLNEEVKYIIGGIDPSIINTNGYRTFFFNPKNHRFEQALIKC